MGMPSRFREAIKHSAESGIFGPVSNCTRSEVYHDHRHELKLLPDERARWDRLVELNVKRQATNVVSDVFVGDAWARGQKLSVHGWVYSIADGLVRDLNVTVDRPPDDDQSCRQSNGAQGDPGHDSTLALHLRSDKAHDDLARMFNSYIRGWINYYGRFCPSARYPTLWHIELYLARWASGEYKILRGHKRRSRHWLLRIAQRQPRLFAHWALLHGSGRIAGVG